MHRGAADRDTDGPERLSGFVDHGDSRVLTSPGTRIMILRHTDGLPILDRTGCTLVKRASSIMISPTTRPSGSTLLTALEPISTLNAQFPAPHRIPEGSAKNKFLRIYYVHTNII